MIVNNRICLHCAACVGSCPTNSIFLHETITIEFLSTCTQCGLCRLVCPVGAISEASAISSLSHTNDSLEVRL
jgi:ferredoxin